MYRKPGFWRKFIYLFVVITQLGQSVVSALAPSAVPNNASAPPTRSTQSAMISKSSPTDPHRPAWVRPAIESLTSFRPLVPPETIAQIPPLPITAENAATLLGLSPFGNNNTGQSYKDSNNPEDHPGKHFAGPVNLVNGNYFLTVGDHFFAASGLSVQLARTYNSQDAFPPGSLGNRWTHSYNATAQDTIPNAQVTIRNGDGSLHIYTSADGGLTWDPPAGIFRTLIHPAQGTPFQLIHKSGVIEIFAPSGQLQSITDRNGNSVQMGYDGMNRLVTVSSDDSRSLTINYYLTNPNLIESIVDPIGRTTFYNYDPSGNLSLVDYPDGTAATYTYDGLNRLVSFNDPRQPEGARQVTGIQYDGLNRVNRVDFNPTTFFTLTYDIPAGPLTQTDWQDALGQTHSIQYDGNFNIITSFSFFAGCACIQGEGYNYNASLLLQNKQDSLGNQIVYVYDTIGNLIRVTSPSGAQTDFGYDPIFSNVISTTNPAGDTIQYLYDGSGNLTQEIHPLGRTATYTYDADGNLLTQSDALGNTTTYTYDPAGNLITVTDPENNTTTFTYDTIGRVTEKVDPRGGSTSYQYDAADRLLQVTDPLSGTISYAYDPRGNLISLTDANGQTIQHQYDELDRLTVVTSSVGLATTYEYDVLLRLALRTDTTGATTSYTYDEANRMTQRVYSDGRIDTFAYDLTGNLIGYTDGSIFTGIQYDDENRPLTYTLDSADFSSPTQIIYAYDPLGNRTQATIDDGSNTFVTTYVYDSLSRLIRTLDTNGRMWDSTYDEADRRTSLTYPDNSHVEYEYDGRNNLTAVRHFDPGNVLERVYTYTHDSLSNLLSENDNGLINSYSYDALNRVSQVTTPNETATYTYDAVGNRLTISGTPYGNNTFTYGKDNNLLSSNDTTYTYDSMGRRISDSGPAGDHFYQYDGEMRLAHWQLGSFDVSLTYDPMGNLVRKQDSSGNGTFLLYGDRGIEAELESNGNVKGAYTIDTEIIAMSLVGVSPITVDFRYDGSGRVRQVTDADTGQSVVEYSTDPTENHPAFYNPIRIIGTYYFPEMGLYLAGDGLFWDPVSGLFLLRFWPWAFWPFGPFSPWRPIFRYWPWPWPWATPWGWPWPRPWPFLWPWPGVWVRPFLIWPMWPWPFFPWLPWWWWSHWWGWPIWSHWWWWHHWWWWDHWWYFGWWWWGWWGWGWWLWGWWWWPWWWWWPCWWIWGWWIWWWWWPWWWWWHWHWWWPWWRWWWWWFWWWPPVWGRPPDYGDAPDPTYPSLLASNGARHLNTFYEWLGPDVDREFNAEITDLDMFDDGVTVDLNNGLITFTVSTRSAFYWYSAAAPIHVHGWIDWNADGDWSDPGEFVLNWSGYPGDGTWPAGATSFTTSVPVAAPGGLPLQMWSRFRLDYAQNVETVTGSAVRGEVEDYVLYSAPNPPPWGGALNVNLTAPLVLTYPTNMVISTVNIDFTPTVSNTVVWSNPLGGGGSSVATILHEPFDPLTTYTVTVSAGQTVNGHWMPANTYTFTTAAAAPENPMIYLPFIVKGN